jgi:hypothetical protein
LDVLFASILPYLLTKRIPYFSEIFNRNFPGSSKPNGGENCPGRSTSPPAEEEEAILKNGMCPYFSPFVLTPNE